MGSRIPCIRRDHSGFQQADNPRRNPRDIRAPQDGVAVTCGGVRDAMFLTGHSGTATLPGMSVELLLTSLVVVLIPGTGVIYTNSIGGGWRHGLFPPVRWA